MTYKPDTKYSKLGSDKYQLLTRTKCKQPKKFCIECEKTQLTSMSIRQYNQNEYCSKEFHCTRLLQLYSTLVLIKQ